MGECFQRASGWRSHLQVGGPFFAQAHSHQREGKKAFISQGVPSGNMIYGDSVGIEAGDALCQAEAELVSNLRVHADQSFVDAVPTVWTGTYRTGESHANNCSDYQDAESESIVGTWESLGSSFPWWSSIPCTSSARVYCFER